jgi:hypothetical protein
MAHEHQVISRFQEGVQMSQLQFVSLCIVRILKFGDGSFGQYLGRDLGMLQDEHRGFWEPQHCNLAIHLHSQLALRELLRGQSNPSA